MENTELVTTRPTAVAIATDVSPWREVANEEQGLGFGALLKFNKGDWLLGEAQTKVGDTVMFLANMDEIWRGWMKWLDKQPVDHVLGRAVDRFRVPLREELGDLDQSDWETDGNGVKRDPWSRVTYLVLRNCENDEIVAFTSTSHGGRQAVGKLCDRFDRLRNKHPAQMPIVALASESYQHREYGKVLKPKFTIIGWDYWDDEAAKNPSGTLQAQRAAELDDEIPF